MGRWIDERKTYIEAKEIRIGISDLWKHNRCGKESRIQRFTGARQIGSLNLTKPNVVEYMNEILEKTKSEEVATTEEVLEFLTSVMRGDIAEQFGLDPAITDRTKAAQLLMKRFNDNQRMDLELTKLEIRFKENMPGEQDNILDALNITASEVWNN